MRLGSVDISRRDYLHGFGVRPAIGLADRTNHSAGTGQAVGEPLRSAALEQVCSD